MYINVIGVEHNEEDVCLHEPHRPSGSPREMAAEADGTPPSKAPGDPLRNQFPIPCSKMRPFSYQ